MNKAYLAGWFYLPLNILSGDQIAELFKELTYVSPFADEDGERKTIYMYRETDTHIGLPVPWVKEKFPSLFEMAEDRRVTTGTLAYSKLPDPNHPSVKDPEGQKKFMDELLLAVQNNHQVFAVAKTGSGKTVCALRTAALLGHRTLVLVDKNKLKDQWIKEIQDKLGIPEERIGIIQQNKCEWEDKDIVVGLMHTNARRDYPDDVYNAFGTVIVDECDVVATEFFSDVIPKFNAKYRIGLTATPNRKDGSDIVMLMQLGDISVRSEASILPVKVHVFKYYKEGKIWGKDDKQQMLAISKDKNFNAILAARIKECYNADRNILVVAERIDQVEALVKLCADLGIPAEDMGQFTNERSKYDRTYEWKVIGRRKSSDDELNTALTKRVVFATIGMVKRAIDVPRWDTLIEAAPFWNGEQLLGRIRRSFKGKKYPLAFTYRHMKSLYAEERYYSRFKEYVNCQAILIHH
jgi:superfamily II DNA or RNA helicase